MVEPILSCVVATLVSKTVSLFFDRYARHQPAQVMMLPRPNPVAFRAASGHFLAADRNRDGLVVADRTDCREWEVFFLQELPDTGGRYALLSSNCRYVCAEGGGGGVLVADRVVPQAWETFELEQSGGRVALRTCGGRYVCAVGGGGGEVVADRMEPQDWERFELIRLG